MTGHPTMVHTEEGMRDGLQIESPDIPATLGHSVDEIDKLKSERVVLRSDKMLNTEKREG